MEIFARYSDATVDSHPDAEVVRRFLRGVYAWMCTGLALTALTASTVSSSSRLTLALADPRGVLFWSLVMAQFALVIVLTRRVNTLGAGLGGIVFVLYSVLMGLTLSPIFMAYTAGYLERTFLVSAGSFAALAFYGTTTRRDLRGIGQFLFMGLVGLLFAAAAQLLWPADILRFMVDFVGVIVFAGLTVWDAQRLRDLALGTGYEQPTALPINGALALYLDFLNLFLSLLGSED